MQVHWRQRKRISGFSLAKIELFDLAEFGMYTSSNMLNDISPILVLLYKYVALTDPIIEGMATKQAILRVCNGIHNIYVMSSFIKGVRV